MPFIKGKSGNPKGRPKGAINNDKAIVVAFLKYLVDGGYEKFKIELDKLEGKQYVNCFLRIARIVISDNILIKANDQLIGLLNNKIKHHDIN